jgi:methylglutaconyl-CoA hydratase
MNHVKLEIKDGIGTIEFFTEQSNALPADILKKLADTISQAGETSDIKVIVLKSGGDRAFCAGANFDELLAVENEAQGHDFFMGFANVINAMRKTPQFIIGRVQGKTVGGGIGIAASCDYCFATQFASIKLSELAVGIGPFIVAVPIARKMGISALSQLGINATEFYNAEWAKTHGLFMEVSEDIMNMDQKVYALASRLAESNPEAMTELKKILWEGTHDWDQLLSDRASISGKLVTSEFTKEFIHQFKSK